ncbi:hypothetical protein [Sphingomonas rhizophila]|uniref:hypothetical protein n=1 Tax=Sphingomonas rhizophila TaxID=2071607 RepID=UPI001FE80EB1|nr:hypothetical protein [Sphingomonas rhizophila]
MSRHGDTIWHLHRAVIRAGETFDRTTIREWCAGRKAPRSATSLRVLERIEHRYRLPEGYFRAKLAHPGRATTGQAGSLAFTPSERRRIAWHLPDDFDRRPLKERAEIVEWVQRVIISGCTDYRRYQCKVLRDRFSLRFPNLAGHSGSPVVANSSLETEKALSRAPAGVVDAPVELQLEMEALVRFKTATLTQVGLERLGKWKEVTAQQKVEHLGLLFGALMAPPGGAVNGLGIPSQSLGLGLLVFPATWDWYARWREERRGFYTSWEVNMLQLAKALTRRRTGWLRQHPGVISQLHPIEGLVTRADLADASSDWDNCCDRMFAFAKSRSKEIERVARVHRDPFEPILPILEAASPVGEYRRITEEIVRLMPDSRKHPRPAAEAVRSFLMLRFGLHLGLRQKNLRELLLCPEAGSQLKSVCSMRRRSANFGGKMTLQSGKFCYQLPRSRTAAPRSSAGTRFGWHFPISEDSIGSLKIMSQYIAKCFLAAQQTLVPFS